MTLSSKLLDMKFMKRANEGKKRQDLQQQQDEANKNSKWKCTEGPDLLGEYTVEYEESYGAFCAHKPRGFLRLKHKNRHRSDTDETASDATQPTHDTIDAPDECSIDDLFANIDSKSVQKLKKSETTLSSDRKAKRHKPNGVQWGESSRPSEAFARKSK